ncbi:unnamed protein product [Rangifer tarandus platyrhynchus]|uniref:Uncharacterized protein n=1 Tax=Rangifer tarandus platyrhynchus TaxID=3082113 RepID=A0ABN9A4G2_RANTA|nr:unnamed protein product [Rangifer tarandus platyrhynchus]
MKVKVLVAQSCLLCIPMTVANQASLSMEFSRQEYWRELPFPSPVDLPNPGIKARSPALQADSLPSEPRIYKEPLFLSCKKKSVSSNGGHYGLNVCFPQICLLTS